MKQLFAFLSIELQQSLLAAYFFLMLIGEAEAAEVYGQQFDKLFKYEYGKDKF